MMMIDIVMILSGLIYFWDIGGGEVKTYSIWQDRLEADRGFADLKFTKTPSQGRIHDVGLSPFREISLGFQERRMQYGTIGSTVMIKVVQCQHGGTFPRLI